MRSFTESSILSIHDNVDVNKEKTYIISHKDEKTNTATDCHVREYYELMSSINIMCGSEHKFSMKNERGVKEAAVDNLAGSAEAAIKLLGFGLKSKLETELKTSIEHSKNNSVENVYTAKAPECGKMLVSYFMLVREYTITIKKEKLFGLQDKTSKIFLKDYGPETHVQQVGLQFTKECGCPDENRYLPLEKGGFLFKPSGVLQFKNSSMKTSFTAQYMRSMNNIIVQVFFEILIIEFNSLEDMIAALKGGGIVLKIKDHTFPEAYEDLIGFMHEETFISLPVIEINTTNNDGFGFPNNSNEDPLSKNV